MGDTPQYVQFGFILISVANLAIVGLLILVFALAVVLRMPGGRQLPTPTVELPGASIAGDATSNWEEQP